MVVDQSVAVVTGAGRGIGRSIARRLALRHTVLAVSRTRSELAETAAGHETIVTHVADIADPRAVPAIVDAVAQMGRLAVWVNNAATLEVLPLVEIDDDTWRHTLAVNLDAVFTGCREALRAMTATGGGVIINIGSLSGVASVEKFPGLAAYNVSKAGVIALTEAVALEGRDVGVRCIALSPGAVDTDLLRRAAPHLNPGMTPDDVAAIVEFLLSDAAAPLSGINVPIFSNR
jgi:NAD(P)-dependent dehydrogenase (short-subunit alcohol dehydrogenase family)